jgi:hypothetical protein
MVRNSFKEQKCVLIKHNIKLVFILKKETNPPIPENKNPFARQMFKHDSTVIPLAF